MVISNICLRQFRNYESKEFKLGDGTTIISGLNGTGKTNLLEAIHILLTGRSFRDSDDDLVQYNKTWWTVSGVIDGIEREVRFNGSSKSYRINEAWYKRLPKYFSLPVVLFEPDDLMLIHGSPKSRRHYLDERIVKTSPTYKKVLGKYDRVITQRNRLLKNMKYDEDQLFIWDMQLVELANNIVRERKMVIDGWNNALPSIYSHIAQKETIIKSVYHSKTPQRNYQQLLIRQLHESRERDKITGTTSIGPHRDDYEFYRDGRSFTTTASRGEIRSLMLCLKRYEVDELFVHYSRLPIILLDDVFSEIDEKRQHALFDLFDKNSIFITSTDYPHFITKKSKVIIIE